MLFSAKTGIHISPMNWMLIAADLAKPQKLHSGLENDGVFIDFGRSTDLALSNPVANFEF